MSRSAKVAKVIPIETPDNSSSDEENQEDQAEELQVEFEARAPDEDDFHGIKLLIKQLFCRNANVNVSKITETILSQRYIGSVIKTVQADEDDLEDDMADDDHIYAISTVLNLAKKEESVDGLKKFLLDQTRAGGDRQVLQYVTELLNKNVGFLLNERYVNIPAQVTVPLLETLVTEMRKATERNLPFNFSHYIMISKLFKTKTDSSLDQQAVVFSNPEEELIVAESELCIDYDVSGETDNDVGVEFEGVEMTPWRRIVVFSADKLEDIIKNVRTNFPVAQPGDAA